MTVASTLWVDVPISVKPASGGAAIDPTAFPVYLAFLPKKTPVAPADWQPATWSPDGKTAGVLVGPNGDVQLPGGISYVVWWRVDTADEQPEEPAPGGLTITEF
jgi:hypothetical protein